MNKTNIKISTIMPVYNASKFLKQSIESVLNQTLRDIELICVDDGSTDNSLEIIENYAKIDKRLKIVIQKHQTAGTARNNGIKYASGEFIHFFDADDWLDPSAYKTLWNKVKGTNLDFCVFQFTSYNQQTKEKILSRNLIINKDQVTSFYKSPKFFIYNEVVPWNKIIRRKTILDNDLKFDEIICANDRSFYFKLLIVSKNILIIKNSLLFYRINNKNSLIGKIRSQNFDCHFKSFYSTFEVYKNQPIKIQKMFIDAFINDFFYFFKLSSLEDKLNNFLQIYNFFNNFNLKIMGNLKNYFWYDDYKKILNEQFILIDPEYESIPTDKVRKYLNCKYELYKIKKSLPYRFYNFLMKPIKLLKRKKGK